MTPPGVVWCQCAHCYTMHGHYWHGGFRAGPMDHARTASSISYFHPVNNRPCLPPPAKIGSHYSKMVGVSSGSLVHGEPRNYTSYGCACGAASDRQ